MDLQAALAKVAAMRAAMANKNITKPGVLSGINAAGSQPAAPTTQPTPPQPAAPTAQPTPPRTAGQMDAPRPAAPVPMQPKPQVSPARPAMARKTGGMISSASKRADGIATKGKTRGKMC